MRFFKENRPFCVFEAPSGELRGNVQCTTIILGSLESDFLLALIELFSLGVTAEELRAIIG